MSRDRLDDRDVGALAVVAVVLEMFVTLCTMKSEDRKALGTGFLVVAGVYVLLFKVLPVAVVVTFWLLSSPAFWIVAGGVFLAYLLFAASSDVWRNGEIEDPESTVSPAPHRRDTSFLP